MAYIANKTVRFDRDYAIGEIIPDSVINPKMTTKLIGMGRIIRIPDKDPQQTHAGGAESPQGGAENAIDGGEFVCEVCGKTFKSQNALAAHLKSHKSQGDVP